MVQASDTQMILSKWIKNLSAAFKWSFTSRKHVIGLVETRLRFSSKKTVPLRVSKFKNDVLTEVYCGFESFLITFVPVLGGE